MQTGVVGRVSVRVFPDTSNFRRKLKSDLERERGLKVQIPVEPDDDGALEELRLINEKLQRRVKTINIPVDVDDGHLHDFEKKLKDKLKQVVNVDFNYKAALREAEAKIDEGLRDQDVNVDFDYEAELRKAEAKINKGLKGHDETIDVDIHVDDHELTDFYDDIEKAKKTARDIELEIQYTDELEKLQKKLDQYRELQVGVDINAHDLENRLKDLQRELRQKQVDIAINLKDDEALKRQIKSIDDDLDDLAKTRKVKIDPDLANPSKLNVQRQLATLGRDRIVEFFAKVNKASLAKAAAALGILSGITGTKNALSDIGDLIEEMGKNAPKVATLATSIAGIVTSVLAMSGDAVSLLGSLTKIGGLGLLAPGFLGGFAVSLTTLIVAFAGLKKELPGVYNQFQKLQQVIQSNFWSKAGKSLRDLLPVLQKSFGGLATSLGNLVGKLAESLIPDLPKMFKNTAKALDILGKAADPIAGIFATLGKSGSEYLPKLAKWIDTIATDFNKWLGAAVKDGRFDKWVQDGVDALKDLWSIGQSAWTTIGNISKAAQKAGGSTLKTFADTMQRIADITGSKSFQSGLTNFFKGLEGFQKNFDTKAAGSISKFFSTIGSSAQDVLPKIGTAFGGLVDDMLSIVSDKSFEKGWSSMWTSLGQAFSAIKPDMKGIAGGLGTILDIGGEIAKSGIKALGKIFSGIGSGLKEARPGLHDFTKNFGKFLDHFSGKAGSGLKDLFKKLGPLGEQLSKAPWGKIGDALGSIAKSGFKMAGDIVDGITSSVKDANKRGDLENFAEALNEIADSLDRISKNKAAVGILNGVGKALGFLLIPMASKKSPVLQQITDFLTHLPNVNQLQSKALALLTNIGGMIIDSLVTGFNNAVHKVREWLEKLTNWIPGWKGPASRDATLLTPNGETIIQSLIDGFQNKLESVKSWLEGLTSKIPGWITSAGTLLADKGKQLLGGLITGLEAKRQGVASWFGKLAKAIPGFIKAPGKLLADIGSKIGTSLATGLSSVISKVKSAAGSLYATARNQVAGNSFWRYGSALGSGFVDGLSTWINNAKNIAGNLYAAARNQVAAKSFWRYGSALGSGFVDGLHAWINNAKSTARSLYAAARNQVAGNSFWRYGSALGSGFVSGLLAWVNNAWNAGSSLGGNASSGARSQSGSLYDAGVFIGAGLVSGINAMSGAAYGAGRGLAGAANLGFRSKAIIASPSKLFKENGEWLGKGLVVGMEAQTGAVFDAARKMAEAAQAGAQSAGSLTTSGVSAKSLNTAGHRPVSASLVASPLAAALTGSGGGGVTVNQNIYNPTVESDAEALNKGLQTAGLFGLT